MSTPAKSSAEPVPLRVSNVGKKFGAVTAVDTVTFMVNAGECFGLLGPNGAGKSTLLRSIVGRVIADRGEIYVFGAEARTDAAKQSLGWVPQDLALYPRLSCRENLASFARYYGLSGDEVKAATLWCLEWAALTDRADDIVNQLSGGMKRRLNMAAGLIHRPRLVLMDEPTVGVDPQSRLRIFEMIERLRSEGLSVIYTTHYMEEAERLCDRIAIMDHGRIIAEGTGEELVRQVFGGKREVVARFQGPEEQLACWVAKRGGKFVAGVAQFTVENPAEVASLLEAAPLAGFAVLDVSLHRPTLESVFLQLTGRELRD
ncbi:MAG: ABC transporter ATP-binding protein [Terriglobales bacterium]